MARLGLSLGGMDLHHYHERQPLTQGQRCAYEDQAAKQDVLVREYLERAYPSDTSAEDILAAGVLHPDTPITSVRRALTNLHKRGRIKKTGTVTGQYGRPVNVYRALVEGEQC